MFWRTAHTGLGGGSESWGCISRTSQDNSEARRAALRSAHGSDGPGACKQVQGERTESGRGRWAQRAMLDHWGTQKAFCCCCCEKGSG